MRWTCWEGQAQGFVCRCGQQLAQLICVHPAPTHQHAADDDPSRLLPCDTCDCMQHSYCLQPPLEQLPLQSVRARLLCVCG